MKSTKLNRRITLCEPKRYFSKTHRRSKSLELPKKIEEEEDSDDDSILFFCKVKDDTRGKVLKASPSKKTCKPSPLKESFTEKIMIERIPIITDRKKVPPKEPCNLVLLTATKLNKCSNEALLRKTLMLNFMRIVLAKRPSTIKRSKSIDALRPTADLNRKIVENRGFVLQPKVKEKGKLVNTAELIRKSYTLDNGPAKPSSAYTSRLDIFDKSGLNLEERLQSFRECLAEE